MKPDFALSLSFEGIGLLHRAESGWERVGEVPLDVADLSAALDLLKKTAAELTDAPLHAKLVLPSEQIKFLTLADPQGGPDVREAAVRAALDGATPYSLEELAYDWSEQDGELRVAAVAKETLKEAEHFALENGFEPIYFTAMPQLGAFSSEPFFGETAAYSDRKEALGALERDTVAIEVIGPARAPIEEAKPEETEAKAAPEPEAEPKPEPEAADTSPEPSENPSAEPAPTFKHDEAPEAAAKADDDPKLPEPPQPSAPDAPFASRRTAAADPASAPALTGVTRHEPRTLAPDIPVEDEPADEQEPAQMEAPAPAPPPEPRAVTAFFSRRSSKRPSEPRKMPSLRSKEAAATPLPTTPPPHVIPQARDEKSRLTVFGARKPATEPVATSVAGGRPRFLGLILTAVLLVFLLGVAAWASIFAGEGLSRFFKSGPEETSVATLGDLDELEIEGEEAMIAEPTTELASLSSELPPSDQVELRPAPNPVPTLTPEEAQQKYAVTGIWVLAPGAPEMPAVQPDDDLYIAAIDPQIEAQDAIALPPLTREGDDGGLGRQSNPAAQGQSFALDGRGLVIATPEGALSPDGHMVFAGKPPYVPRSLPDRSAIEAPQDTETAKLSAVRPKLRPGGLIEANERATLGGRSLKELAAIRPKLRPRSAQELARVEEVDPQPEEQPAAETVPQTPGAVAIKLPDPDETPKRDLDPNATPQAVATSVKPKNRPRNFSRIVKRAERNKEQVEQVAAVAPRTVAPKIPSSASVAKQATVRNAINLRRVNLIGVYGKPSSRRALVRLANGRYKKVKVGDRIDGGRVSAIGDSELRYQKGGRSVTLKMPRG